MQYYPMMIIAFLIITYLLVVFAFKVHRKLM